MTSSSSPSFRAYASATVANLTCGYDILGLAVDAPGDEVEISFSGKRGVDFLGVEGNSEGLPDDPEKNTAVVAARAFLQAMGYNEGVQIKLIKHMPVGSGLGSSAASAVATVYGLNELFDCPLSKKDLLPFCMKAEKAACGYAHADNVAPALFGGITLIRSYEPLDVISLPIPDDLWVAILHPPRVIRTRDSREVLPQSVSPAELAAYCGNLGGMITALATADYDLLSRSMHDELFEAARAPLLPGFFDARERALREGAIAFGLSGSGPSVYALCRGKEEGEKIMEGVKKVLLNKGEEASVYVSTINRQGPRLKRDLD